MRPVLTACRSVWQARRPSTCFTAQASSSQSCTTGQPGRLGPAARRATDILTRALPEMLLRCRRVRSEIPWQRDAQPSQAASQPGSKFVCTLCTGCGLGQQDTDPNRLWAMASAGWGPFAECSSSAACKRCRRPWLPEQRTLPSAASSWSGEPVSVCRCGSGSRRPWAPPPPGPSQGRAPGCRPWCRRMPRAAALNSTLPTAPPRRPAAAAKHRLCRCVWARCCAAGLARRSGHSP